MTTIAVDADACPVKEEVYTVARRHRLQVVLVANSWMSTPLDDRIRLQVVQGRFDAADDWIVDHVGEGDVVVTTDILLASRCLQKGARAISPKGEPFTEDNIGDAVATRDLLEELRSAGGPTGGPRPFEKRDRSRFLQQLDEMVRCL